jgi:hypothetical protein
MHDAPVTAIEKREADRILIAVAANRRTVRHIFAAMSAFSLAIGVLGLWHSRWLQSAVGFALAFVCGAAPTWARRQDRAPTRRVLHVLLSAPHEITRICRTRNSQQLHVHAGGDKLLLLPPRDELDDFVDMLIARCPNARLEQLPLQRGPR